MKCPYCSQEHPANTKLCPETGDKIKMNNVGDLIACNNPRCEDYGKKILPADSHFCPSCGWPLATSTNRKGEIFGYIMHDKRYTFIGNDGKPIPNLDSCQRLKSDIISGKQNFSFFYDDGSAFFYISHSGIVSLGIGVESNIIDADHIEIIEGNDIFSKIYNKYGIRQFGNIKTKGVAKLIDEKYLIGKVGIDSIGVIDIQSGKELLRTNIDQLAMSDLATLPESKLIVVASKDDCFYHLDIDKMLLVKHDLDFTPKKIFVLDDKHVLINKKYNERYIYDISGNIVCFTTKNPDFFGNVVVLEETNTLYLKNNKIFNYPTAMLIGHYGIVYDDNCYGLMNMENGQIIVEVKFDSYSPIFNNKNDIQFICFWCNTNKKHVNSIIFDIVSGYLFVTDITKEICMISQQNDYIFLYTADGMSIIYDQNFNVKFKDDWREYSTVIPMNGNFYYLKGNEFGEIKDGKEYPSLTIRGDYLMPLYGIEKILAISEKDILVIDPFANEKYYSPLIKKSDLKISTQWRSLLHYRFSNDCLFSWEKEINANSNECNGLYYLKGLTTVDQKWKNIFYPYYEEETIF